MTNSFNMGNWRHKYITMSEIANEAVEVDSGYYDRNRATILASLEREHYSSEDAEQIFDTMKTDGLTQDEAITAWDEMKAEYQGEKGGDRKDDIMPDDLVEEDQYIDGLGTVKGDTIDMGKGDPTTKMISSTYSKLLDYQRALVNTIVKTHPEVSKDQKVITYFNGINTELKNLKKYLSTQNSLKEDIDLGHEDNEPHMIKGDLYRIGKYAMELYAMADKLEKSGQEIDFPAWWQAMITDAKEQMVKAKHYLDFELNEPAINASVDTMSLYEKYTKA